MNKPVFVRITDPIFGSIKFDWKWNEPTKLSWKERFLRFIGIVYVIQMFDEHGGLVYTVIDHKKNSQ